MDYKVLQTILCDRGRAEKSSVGDLTKLKTNTLREQGDWYVWADVAVSNKWRLDKLLKGSHDIYSVWRMSDNVTFTVGDMINTHGKIKRLRKVPSGSKGIMYQFSCHDRNGWIDLDTIPKNYHHKYQTSTKDFEIRELKSTDSNQRWGGGKIVANKLFNSDDFFKTKNLDYILKVWKIYSVYISKKQSLFQIGDTVLGYGGITKTITGFEIVPEHQTLRIRFDDGCGLLISVINDNNFSLYQYPQNGRRTAVMSEHALKLQQYQRSYNQSVCEMNAFMSDMMEDAIYLDSSKKLLLLL